MTYTPTFKLMREYLRNRQLILEALPEGSAKAEQGIADLQR